MSEGSFACCCWYCPLGCGGVAEVRQLVSEAGPEVCWETLHVTPAYDASRNYVRLEIVTAEVCRFFFLACDIV